MPRISCLIGCETHGIWPAPTQKPTVVGETSQRTSSNAEDLFALDDADVVVVDRRVSPSSSQSHPPTSDSEDPPSAIQGSWMGNENDMPAAAPSERAVKKVSKKSEVRCSLSGIAGGKWY